MRFRSHRKIAAPRRGSNRSSHRTEVFTCGRIIKQVMADQGRRLNGSYRGVGGRKNLQAPAHRAPIHVRRPSPSFYSGRHRPRGPRCGGRFTRHYYCAPHRIHRRFSRRLNASARQAVGQDFLEMALFMSRRGWWPLIGVDLPRKLGKSRAMEARSFAGLHGYSVVGASLTNFRHAISNPLQSRSGWLSRRSFR